MNRPGLCYAPFSMNVWHRTGARLVALLLAAVVCADITLGAGCDPVELPGPTSGTEAVSAYGESADACATFCIPDCFCCSRSETASAALTLPPLTATAKAPAPRPGSVSAVVRPVPEPPPLALS